MSKPKVKQRQFHHLAVGLLSILASSQAFSIPFHGCTFYKPRMLAASWPGGEYTGCANFSATYGACTKVHCSWWGCTSYPGVWFQGWLPEYFVEVTPHLGSSAFALSLDGALLKEQMLKASAFWKLQMPSATPEVGPRPTSHDSGHEFKLLFGRVLSTPYGPVGWSIPSLGTAGGQGVPAFYKAISEFAPVTWADDFTRSGDRAPASLWAPVTSQMCNGIGAAAQGAIASVRQGIASLPIPTGIANRSGVPAGFAYPLPIWLQAAGSYSGADTSDPAKQCMGSLGPLLPRTGWVEAPDVFTAAQQAAWRISSLAQDQFHNGVGVLQDDKWQLVWPETAYPACFAPGGLDRPNNALPHNFFPPKTLTDGSNTPPSLATQGPSVVFAVWRKRGACLEPWEKISVLADLNLFYVARQGACALLNTTDGMP